MHMPENKTPTISVAMGVLYRRESLTLLQRSIESILNQTFANFEFLICDDGSLWEAQKIVEIYAEKDERIKLVRPGDKLDLASKLNCCLQKAKGEYIARMDDDDYSFSERLEKQVQLLDENPEIAFVGSNVKLNRGGKICGERVLPEYPQVKDFYMTQPYIHPALMFRKEAVRNVGGYSERKWQYLCEDYDLLLKLYARGYRGMNLQESLLEYTIPITAKGNRRMRHRLNEAITRYERFGELGALPRALPYVLKPLVVGLLPEKLMEVIKVNSTTMVR